MIKSKYIFYVLLYIISIELFGGFFMVFIDNIDKESKLLEYDWIVSITKISALFLLLIIFRKNIREYIEKIEFSVKKIGIYILLGIVYTFILNFIYFVLNTSIFSFNPINTHKFSYIISVVLIAPFVEEIIYRVILIEYLIKKNVIKIWIVSFTSLFFGLIHLPNFSQVFFTFFLGIICSLVYIKERNLLYPILIHFIYNLFSVFIG